MALVKNLDERGMYASLCVSNQPDTDRIVLMVEQQDEKVLAVTVRYREGKWYGECTGDQILPFPGTVWLESPYQPKNVKDFQHDNTV